MASTKFTAGAMASRRMKTFGRSFDPRNGALFFLGLFFSTAEEPRGESTLDLSFPSIRSMSSSSIRLAVLLLDCVRRVPPGSVMLLGRQTVWRNWRRFFSCCSFASGFNF